jgi:hypothetical protein
MCANKITPRYGLIGNLVGKGMVLVLVGCAHLGRFVIGIAIHGYGRSTASKDGDYLRPAVDDGHNQHRRSPRHWFSAPRGLLVLAVSRFCGKTAGSCLARVSGMSGWGASSDGRADGLPPPAPNAPPEGGAAFTSWCIVWR